VTTDDLDVTIVGAGLLGLATSLRLLEHRPGLRVAVLDKESAIATHQSGRNSGVLHAGLYYAPGSLKARLCRDGRNALIEFAEKHSIPFRLCGKLVVETDSSEAQRFDDLAARGRSNGLALEIVGPKEMREIEPHVHGTRAMWVPESGVIDYGRVAAAYRSELLRLGGQILLGRRVERIVTDNGRQRIEAGHETLRSRAVITCAGLQSDRLAAMTRDGDVEYRVVPFRGDYYTFKSHAEDLVRGLVYPVPDPSFPFLGVHFTRGVDGRLQAGPNAVPAFAREGYRRLSLNREDARDLLTFPGFWRLARSYARTGVLEIWRDLVKSAFLAQMRRYVPEVRGGDVAFGPSGVRAQCMTRDGALVDDFLVEKTSGALHIVNAPSPAATASLAIGQHVAETAIREFHLT
jgi:L-2-hydroxyglutarate oxidase